MNLSVEIEPPSGAFLRIDEKDSSIYKEILSYANLVDMISITNRPVFGLSPITLASQIQKLVEDKYVSKTRINLHLTTRLSHFDTFKTVLDTQRIGLSDLLPILGDPRGPKDPNYFINGFEILGFVSFLKSGNTSHLLGKYRDMMEKGALVGPIKDANYSLGSIVDVNPTKSTYDNKTVSIREKQIKFAKKKEKLGAEYLISQATYDADHYFSFLEEADLGIPILAGVMPARLKLIKSFGIPISHLWKSELRAQFTTEEEKQVGNRIASEVFQDLIERGCEDIHVYSIGNSSNFSSITDLEINEDDTQSLESRPVQKGHK